MIWSSFPHRLFNLSPCLSDFLPILHHGEYGAKAVPPDRGKLTLLEQIKIKPGGKLSVMLEFVDRSLDVTVPDFDTEVAGNGNKMVRELIG